MKNEEKESFFNDIKGTFLEKILSVPIIEIEREIRSDDTVIGEASLFEKKCFLFYLSNYPPTKKGDEPLSFAEMLKLEMQAMEAISIMRLIIAERLNVCLLYTSDAADE